MIFPRFAALSVSLTLNASPLQDLDAGTFLFEMAGHRWATDLGADSYGLSGYWSKSSAHGNRYSYCTCACSLLLHAPARTVRAPVAWLERPHPTLRPDRKSTRGHNTLTFDGTDEQPGWCAQDDTTVSAITTFNCSTPHALIDL